MRDSIVICTGGSETLGVRSTRGYPEHLGEMLHNMQIPCLVQNCGVAGDKLVDMLRRLPILLATAPRGRHVVLVMALPLHDAQGGGTPPAELITLLQQAVTWGMNFSDAMLLCTPTPIGVSPLAPVRGFVRSSRRWVDQRGVSAVKDVAATNKIDIVEWHTMDKSHLIDVAHPGPAGYRWKALAALPLVLAALGAAPGSAPA